MTYNVFSGMVNPAQSTICVSFSVLTLMAGWQEGYRSVKTLFH